MLRLFANGMFAAAAVIAISALAYAEETIIEKRTYESDRATIEAVPQARERVVEEREVTKPSAVQRRTDTVTTTTNDNDNDDDNDND